MTRLGELLDFGQVFNAFGNNFVDIWRFISGHTAQGLRKNVFANKLARRKTLKSASTKKLKGKK